MIVGFELEPHVPAVTESRQASRRVWKHGIKTPSSEEAFLDDNMVLLDLCLSHGKELTPVLNMTRRDLYAPLDTLSSYFRIVMCGINHRHVRNTHIYI